jgi:hypothetical protein
MISDVSNSTPFREYSRRASLSKLLHLEIQLAGESRIFPQELKVLVLFIPQILNIYIVISLTIGPLYFHPRNP